MSQSSRQRGSKDGRPIGDIARALLRRKKLYEKGKFSALVSAWSELVGEAIAARTHIRAFKDGGLVIEVDSPALLHELSGFMKKQLVSGLQATEAGKDVAGIRLCLGTARSERRSNGAGRGN